MVRLNNQYNIFYFLILCPKCLKNYIIKNYLHTVIAKLHDDCMCSCADMGMCECEDMLKLISLKYELPLVVYLYF